MASHKLLRLNLPSLIVGILIPITVALIPYAISFFSPEINLTYSLVGPIKVGHQSVFSISVKNDGKDLERDVQVWVDKPPTENIGILEHNKSLTELVGIDTPALYRLSENDGDYILDFGDLRPGDSFTASIAADWIYLSQSGDAQPSGLSVKSSSHLANYIGHSVFPERLYRVGFWWLLSLVVLFLCFAFYEEYFSNPNSVENNLAKEPQKARRKSRQQG